MKPKIVMRWSQKVFDRNPFIKEGRVDGQIIVEKKELVRSEYIAFVHDGGEILGEARTGGFWRPKVVDSTQFVKLFADGVKALQGLTSAGTRVFEVLYWRIRGKDGEDKDRVFLAFTEIDQVLTPMSEATYRRGLKELIEKEFIAPSPTVNMFWLNPAFVWNGTRLLFVDDYVLDESPESLGKSTVVRGLRPPVGTVSKSPSLPFEEEKNEPETAETTETGS